MQPLERLEEIDSAIHSILADTPQGPYIKLGQWRAALRQYYNQPFRPDSQQSRRERLRTLCAGQWQAEADLRLDDQTMSHAQHRLVSRIVTHPSAALRQGLPRAEQAQIKAVVLSASQPFWRTQLRSCLVITAAETEDEVVLFSLAHGFEGFNNLQALTTELAERLDDEVQGAGLLDLLPAERQLQCRSAQTMTLATQEQDVFQHLLDAVIAHQRRALKNAWHAAAAPGPAIALQTRLGSAGSLATRYSALLDRHMPPWFRSTPLQGLTHMMQSLQELASAIELASAPGLLTLQQFQQRNTLLDYCRDTLRRRLLNDHGQDLDPDKVLVSTTLIHQGGPLHIPTNPGSSVPGRSRPQAGDILIPVRRKRTLSELALENVSLFDVDYWLTARITHSDGRAIPWLSAGYVKRMVRDLDVAGSYEQFLRRHLLTASASHWRRQAYRDINRARMRAEAIKGRYAGYFRPDREERGYRWAMNVIDYPDSSNRPAVAGQKLDVQQLLIAGATAQGVLVISPQATQGLPSILLYTPDAPDRKPWREFDDRSQLWQALQQSPSLQAYLIGRLARSAQTAARHLFASQHNQGQVRSLTITADFFAQCYQAEVRHFISNAAAQGTSTGQLDAEQVWQGIWLIVDLITVFLPSRVQVPLAFARCLWSIWDGLESLPQADAAKTLEHFYGALSHATDGLAHLGGSALMRQTMRRLPGRAPKLISPHLATQISPDKLRYRIDGHYHEGVYEQVSDYQGLSQYYIKDLADRYYRVSFDGSRWRIQDPRQPDAYLHLPIRRNAQGHWEYDAPVRWSEGLPDLPRLIDDSQLATPMLATAQENGILNSGGRYYLQWGARQLAVEPSLLMDQYRLVLPDHLKGAIPTSISLRWQTPNWHIRVRQTGRASDWLPLPEN
ncbi:hypothetical protein LOY54_25240 [Pseudomonas sp. B21-032]|uniref:dermonecrotic toxin domain-containing protein n=1 Tax=Pseudomonas sp. B21-032 TaxID=2895483 RepID=UPI00215EB3A4|nr:DUF6543 domain-containing protein [Pseudomonas sp. B21-032]UVL61265.1 hypothetical protein LOY54_25240 [Pseudomonas sp. B21-032]